MKKFLLLITACLILGSPIFAQVCLTPATPTGTLYLCLGGTTTLSSGLPTGGTITTSGGNRIHTFTGAGSYTLTVPAGFSVDALVLVVAGGGGGGANGGGGGGAGGLIYNSNYLLSSSASVTVGGGGAGSANANTSAGSNGGNSIFGTLTAIGGGGGASRDGGPQGQAGGSGGGGGGASGTPRNSPGGGTAGQGSAGGSGTTPDPGCSAAGGGGGGAGGAGTAAANTHGGNGGAGVSNSISGVATFYAAGGGGGLTCGNATLGTGGSGGGGNGGGNPTAAVAGTANTGSGGGGGGQTASAAGGSGIVIVAYPNIPAGTWSSSNTAVATVNSSTGFVTAVGPGTATISYTVSGCSSASSTVITVYSGAPVTGTTTICAGSTTTLTTAVPTGGNITSAGGNRIHTFTSSGSFVTPSGFGASANVLTVGGGGGGGQNGGGGGGGGGFLYTTGVNLATGSSTTVTVGAGGAASVNSGGAGVTAGGNSVFGSITAFGGGGGASRDAGGAAVSGGSGGGGGGCSASPQCTAGNGIAGQGNNGQAGFSAGCNAAGGGGGGAGGVGTAGANYAGGNGGVGLSNSISGSAVFYAGGGGGGPTCSPGTSGSGGNGGGGAGNGTSGTANTGGGGGGNGGIGGSGVVIVSYPDVTSGTWSSNNTGVATVSGSVSPPNAPSVVVTGVSAGTATITFTPTNACYAPQSIVVTVNAQPNVSSFSLPSASASCAGTSSTVTVNSSTLGNGTFTVTYSLTGSNNFSNQTASLAMSGGTGTFSVPGGLLGTNGNTTVTITKITNSTPCSITVSGSNTVTIVVNVDPTANAGSALSSICQGGTSAALGGSVGGAATGGFWGDGGVGGTFNSGTTNLNTTYTPPSGYSGAVTLTLTTTGGGCGTTTASKTLVVGATPTANAGSALSAVCTAITTPGLGGSVGGSATGGTWTDGGVGGTFNSGATVLNTTYTPPAGYSGTVALTLTTSGGPCSAASASKTLVVNPYPVITSSPTNVTTCLSSTATFTVGTSAVGPTYQWQMAPDNATWSNVTNNTPTGATYTNSGTSTLSVSSSAVITTYYYRCVVTTNSCSTASASATLAVTIALPTLATIQGTTAVCLNGTSTLTCPAPTGGTSISTVGGYRIHKFTTTGASTFTVPAGFSGGANVLVVAGGGGGGNNGGGGGGAGGLYYNAGYSLSGGSYAVTVGGNGTGSTSTGVPGTSGGNSVFGSTTMTGGGGGASRDGGGAGFAGGSGGGGSSNGSTAGGAGTSGQGFAGGNAYSNGCASGGGGGGGAAGAGGNGSAGSNANGGNGGAGLSYSISGSSQFYAGGGGGGVTCSPGTAGTGGSGVGGGGNVTTPGVAGATNTGSGGGGGGSFGIGSGGNGGTGVVIVAYPDVTNGVWSSNNTGVATVNSSGFVTGVGAGTATISYTVTEGSCTTVASTTFTVNAPLNVSNFAVASATSPCPSGASTVTINSTSIGNGTYTVTYNVTGANNSGTQTATLTMSSNTGTFTVPGALLATAGSNTVAVTQVATSTCSAAVSSSTSLTVNPNPTVNVGSALSTICQAGLSSGLGGSVGGGATGGTWSDGGFGGGFSGGATNLNTTYFPPPSFSGTVTLTLTTSGGFCGTTAASKTLVVAPFPTANSGSALSSICQGGVSAALGGSVGGSATGGTWSDGGVGGAFNSGATVLNTTYTPPVGYTGTLTLTLTTSGGPCAATASSKTLVVNPYPIITSNPSNVLTCVSGSATFTVGTSAGSPSYQWQMSSDNASWVNVSNGTPTGASYSNATTATLTVTSSSAISLYYYRCVVTAGSCSTPSASATLRMTYSLPTLATITGTTAVCLNGTATLSCPAPTGGNITTANGYRIHTFTASGSFTAPSGFSSSANVLVVAGGGGSGANGGGGGGAGGVLYNTGYSLAGTIGVTIGSGGAASANSNTSAGSNGSNSVFGTITAIGGGGGASRDGGPQGQPGGSGGGGGGASGTPRNSPGAGTSGQGSSGGFGTAPDANCNATGGGGGGAGAVGSSSSPNVGGNGGAGILNSISGTATYYGGGGGGGLTCNSTTVGTGGLGGGGNGGGGSTVAQSGTANTGGGGGGNGGNGGSGVVIVAYPDISSGVWSSSNTSVATVNSSGFVTGVGAGTATISYTVTLGNCTSVSSTTFTVNAPLNVSNFTVASATSPCPSGASTVTINSTSIGNGTYTVTYNVAGTNNSGTQTASITISSNTGTFTVPGALLATAGSNTVTVTQVATATCSAAVSSSTSLTVNPNPTVNAGSALSTICRGGTSAALGGSVGGGATGGTWSDGGIGGTFNSGATSLNTTWTPPAAYSGTATLTLTTSGGFCSTTAASKTQVVTPFPTANAGGAIAQICQGGTTAGLGGSVGGSATGGVWTDGGVGGSFSPSASTLNATYTPPSNYSGTVTLTLTTTGGPCSAATATNSVLVNGSIVPGTVTGAPATVPLNGNVAYMATGYTGTFSMFQYQWNTTSGTWNDWGTTTLYNWTATNEGWTLYVRSVIVNGACTVYSAPVATLVVSPNIGWTGASNPGNPGFTVVPPACGSWSSTWCAGSGTYTFLSLTQGVSYTVQNLGTTGCGGSLPTAYLQAWYTGGSTACGWGSINAPGTNSITFTAPITGTHLIGVTSNELADNNSCGSATGWDGTGNSAVLEYIQNTGVSASVSSANICAGGTETLTATITGGGSPSVNWSIVAGGGSISGTTYSAGTYTGPVTVMANVGVCYSQASFDVVPNMPTLANITGNTTICQNATTTLSCPLPTGGTVTTSGDYRIHTFTGGGTFTVPAGFNGTGNLLVVGGGGGGGQNGGGGGGGGGYIYNDSYSITGGTYPVTVGAGGAPSVNGGTAGVSTGGNSVIGSITAYGGGGGASRDAGGAAVAGGSGGGGGGAAASPMNVAGGSIGGQGNAGGNGTAPDLGCAGAGGGGGGAGSAGTAGSSNAGGTGGGGGVCSISGTVGYYAAGGGGGAVCSPGTAGSGGLGGGGTGNGTSGTANTGGGGGGNGGAGGSGIVIVSYPNITSGSWSSSNTAVATVNSGTGVVTGVGAGTATITYTVNLSGCTTAKSTTVTVNALPGTNNFTLASATPACGGAASTVTVSSSSLGNATFTVTYGLSGANNASNQTASLAMSSGTGNFTVPGALLGNPGSTTVTVSQISNSNSCNTSLSSGNTIVIPSLPALPAITGTTTICANTTSGLSIAAPTGGTITQAGGYRIHKFISGGTFTAPTGFSASANVLVVGGGGGGGQNGGGGGGGGGLVYNAGYSLSSGSYSVTIGGGGTTGANSFATGNNGSGSAFGSITAAGGGGGASRDGGGAALAGGSGGGGSGDASGNAGNTPGASSPVGQGNAGGAGTAPDLNCLAAGGGGGGAGLAGFAGISNTGGTGGAGQAFLISGTSTYYAGGGGGGITCNQSGGVVGAGGAGGGGNGGGGTSALAPTSGAANTGGGGGGGETNGVGNNGGTGGSGIVIVAYPDITAGVWSSDNTAVATVNSSTGVVTGVSGGTAHITYTVTSGGCTTSQSTLFTVTPLASVGSVTGAPAICISGTTTYTANSVVLSGGSGAWSSSNGSVATVNSSGLVTGQAAGTSNIVYTVTGGCGGTTSAQQTVTVDPPVTSYGTVTATAGTAQSLCANVTPAGTFTVTGAAGGSGSFSYQWYYQNGLISPPSGAIPGSWTACTSAQGTGYNTATFAPVGTSANISYACVVTPASAPACVGTATWASGDLQMTVGLPTASITGGNVQVCQGASVTLNATSQFTATWQWQGSPDNVTYTDIGSATSANYSPVTTSPGLEYYHVIATYTVGSGCTPATSNAQSVTVSPPPSVAPLSTTSICTGGSNTLTLTASGGVSAPTGYQWQYFNGITWSNIVNNTPANMTYSVNSSGQTSTITFNTTTGVASGTLLYRGQVSFSGSGCTPLVTGNSGNLIIQQQPVAATITPNVPAGAVCAGQALSASFNSASGGSGTIVDVYEYSVDGGTTFNTYAQNQAINTSSLSGQSVIIRSSRTATGSGCSTSPYKTVTWTVVAQPVAATITRNVAAGAVCAGQGLSATFSGGSGGSGTVTDVYQYSIDGGNTFNAYTGGQTINTSALAGQTVVIQSSRTATGTGCNTSSFNTVSWLINANPSITASNTGPYCSYETIFISAAPSGYTDYKWSGPNGYGPADGISQTIPASGNGGTYTVTVTNANSCSATASTMVTVHAVAAASASNTGPYCNYDNISLSATPVGMAGYNWSGPNGYTGSGQNPATFAANGNAGTYNVIVTDGNGCSASAQTTVVVTTPVSPTASNTGPYVVGQTIDLSAMLAGGSNFVWSGPNGYSANGTTQSISDATLAMAGTYTVTATNSGTGCTAAGTTDVVITNTAAYTWTGTTSTDWTDPSNWSPTASVGGPNACAIDVIIPSVVNNPVIRVAVSVGNLQMNSGSQLTLNGANISVCKDLTGGTGSNAAVIGDGVVVLTGSTLQTFTGYFSMQELNLSNSAGASMLGGSAVDLYTSLDLQTGNFDATNGTLTFKSNTVDSVAILDNFSQNYTGTITGNITAERYYASSNTQSQHYMGSPVNSPSLINQFGATGTGGGQHVLDTYCDETQTNYNSPYGTVFQLNQTYGHNCGIEQWVVETSGNAQNGLGYSILKAGAGKLVLNGPANLDDNYQISGLQNAGWSNATMQGRPQTSGWQLLSNPYLATLDVSTVPPGFDNQIQIWRAEGPFQNSYQPGLIGSDAVVAPFQGFMVHKTAVGGSATFTINAADRVRTPATFYQQNANELKIIAANNTSGLLDQTTVAFNSAATDTFDALYDAQKMAGSLGRHTIYTINNNKWMAINALNNIASTSTVPVGFEPGKTGAFTFSFNGVNTFDPTSYIYLEDRTTTQWYNVRNGNYTFNADSADGWNRFVLHFTPPALINTVDATCNTGGTINIQQPGSAYWNYALTDSNSNVIAQGTLNQTQPVTLQAATGTYTLTLTDTNNYVAVKTIQVNGPTPVSANFMVSADTVIPQQTVVVVAGTTNAASYLWNFGNGISATGSQAMVSYTTPGVYVLSLLVTNDAGCSSTQTHSVTVSNNATGLSNLTANGDLSIWSNDNKVYVDFTQLHDVDAVVCIYNMLGQEISNEHYNNNNVYQKEIDKIEAAYMVVMVRNANKITTRKVLITNSK